MDKLRRAEPESTCHLPHVGVIEKICPNCGKPLAGPDNLSERERRHAAIMSAKQRWPDYPKTLSDPEDTPATGWRWLIGLNGRVNRKNFLLRLVICETASWSSVIFWTTKDPFSVWGWFGIFVEIGALVVLTASTVRRCHDFGSSGKSASWFVVPVVGFALLANIGTFATWMVAVLVLCIRKGQAQSNDHGFQPTGFEVGIRLRDRSIDG